MKRLRDTKPYVFRLGILAVVVLAISTLVPSALGQTKPEVLAAGATANVWLAGGEAIAEIALPEQIEPATPLPATPWGTPVLVSPRNGTALFHYPRTTTLAWQPVLTATAYVVEAAYLSGSTWNAYPPVTVTGNSNSDYTFTFVGDQKGRWRVTAFNGTIYSAPSSWWTFSYNTTPQMATPIQTNPTNNEIFGHYPRNLRPLSTGAHAVVEDGPRGGGLQAGDSVLRLHEDYVRELPPRHDIGSANVRLFF